MEALGGPNEEHAGTPPLDISRVEGGDSEHSTVTHGDDGNPNRSSLPDQLEDMSISKNDVGRSASDWDSLPDEIDAQTLALLGFHDLFRARLVCKSFRDVVKRKTFQQARGGRYPIECSLSPLVFYVKDGNWHILGFEYKEQIWRKLPYLDSRPIDKKPVDNDVIPIPIPIPDMDLFKDFLVSGHGGLFCVNVGKPTEPEKILVFNPLNGLTVQIPPLLCRRHPVVLHLHSTMAKNVDVVSSRYWILAVGSSATGTESLSRKTEVYDSVKGEWEAAGDVPGTDFSINEHQSGVFCPSENAVLVTGFMVSGNKGVLVFDLERLTWREDWLCPYLQHPVEETGLPVHFAIAQLVESSGVIYLFSEQESGTNVTHCIDALDMISGGGVTWTRKVTRQRQGYRALLVYPEYTCVPVRENKLCIFNTIERTGVVYNMLDDPINPETQACNSNLPICERWTDVGRTMSLTFQNLLKRGLGSMQSGGPNIVSNGLGLFKRASKLGMVVMVLFGYISAVGAVRTMAPEAAEPGSLQAEDFEKSSTFAFGIISSIGTFFAVLAYFKSFNWRRRRSVAGTSAASAPAGAILNRATNMAQTLTIMRLLRETEYLEVVVVARPEEERAYAS